MRLSDQHRAALSRVLDRWLPSGTPIYLFGSRTDDSQRGGDIDLCVSLADVGELPAKKHVLVAELRAAADDQRVDIHFVAPEKLATDPFWRQAMRSAIRIDGFGT